MENAPESNGAPLCNPVDITFGDGTKGQVNHGSVVIAAITSCTNTSNPAVMIAAALLAKKAVEKGLKRRSEEHTSELQSLMRISYAVFCLKKKKNINNEKPQNHTHN